MGKYTPMMQQYLEIKKQHHDAILFFRLGDFYEMFFEDALKASQILNITLTGRDAGQKERVPMCGIPYHAASSYIAKLTGQGLKVAICEQVSDPAKSPGLVDREVIRVITPGTLVDASLLDAASNNYIASIALLGNHMGLSYADVSTGLFRLTELSAVDEKIMDELLRISPVELVIGEDMQQHPLWDKIKDLFPRAVVNTVSSYTGSYQHSRQVLLDHFGIFSLDCFDCEQLKAGTTAAGMLLGYIEQLQKHSLSQFTSLQSYKTDGYMVIDNITRQHLELVRENKSKKNTLFDVLNFTKTAMGTRRLKEMLQQPLMDLPEIEDRLDAVKELKDNSFLRYKLSEQLNMVNDLERLASRIAFGQANTRDLLQLKTSLKQIPRLLELTCEVSSNKLFSLRDSLDPLETIADLIENAIMEEGASSLTEGNIIKTGYSPEVDNLRSFTANSKQWLIDLETRERERTGIKSLKVKFNKVFGYFIEVTKSNLDNVPEDYIRKQTLVNCERYITSELKDFESQALSAEDKLCKLEYELFCEIRETIVSHTAAIQQNAAAISQLDVFQSLAEGAARNNYTRPRFNHSGRLKIVDGRHPVVEQSVGEENFVPNDVLLTMDKQRIILLTGPNMSGKSTFLRQVALMVLMAQAGSFVPAGEADIALTDRIFTRIGASDDIATGRSTFMVEMSEVANILHNAGENSLILLDEVGRGTATYDGLSLAWAIVEHLTTTLQAKTLFATHYHELTMLADTYPSIKNFYVAAKEVGDTIAFIHKVLPGKSDRSYGIQVARLAGLPRNVVKRAEEILSFLESKNNIRKGDMASGPGLLCHSIPAEISATSEKVETAEDNQVKKNQVEKNREAMKAIETVNRLKALDLQDTTPLEALNFLYEIQSEIRKSTEANNADDGISE